MHEGRSQNQRGGATLQKAGTWAGPQAEGLGYGWSLEERGLRLEHSLGGSGRAELPVNQNPGDL